MLVPMHRVFQNPDRQAGKHTPHFLSSAARHHNAILRKGKKKEKKGKRKGEEEEEEGKSPGWSESPFRSPSHRNIYEADGPIRCLPSCRTWDLLRRMKPTNERTL